MKKITLLLFTLLFVAFGQSQNIALSGTATASSETQAASNANDGNAGTRWESAFTNTEHITIDLGASYDVTQVILNWEGAFADVYDVLVSDDASFASSTTLFTTTTGDGGIDDLTGLTGTGRYVRMNGLNRFLGDFGFSLWEFEVYGTLPAGTDARLSDLAVDATTITGFSSATEDYTYDVAMGVTVVPTVTYTVNEAGATAVLTPAASIPGTTSIVVTSSDMSTTKTYTVAFAEALPTSPSDNAATPPVRNAIDVISIFSGEYSDVAGTDYNPNWGQSGFGTADTAFDPGTGDLVLGYPNFNYQGNQWGSTQNISAMEFLHVDIWINGTFNPNVFVISSGGEIAHPITNTGAASWISVDIPVAGITGDLANAIQFKFDNGNGTTDGIYVDNLYFWKTPAAAGTDATLSDLQVDMATVAGFSSNTETYSVELPQGTAVVPQITLATTTDAGASRVITQAPGIPGDATVLVTAADMSTTKTYTVSFDFAPGPGDNATTPPARAVADVISIFSGAYTDVAGTDYNPNWGQSGFGSADTAFDPGTGDLVLAYPNFNYQGNAFGSTQDISAMEFLHVDIWVDGTFNPNVFVISSGGEIAHPITNTGAGTWISVNIPVAGITGDLANAIQFKFDNGNGSTDGIYVDNLYFFKGYPLNVDEFELANVSAYPNPTENVWNIRSLNETINSIQVFDILGKQVLTINPNANEVEIDASGLNTGLYFAKVNAAIGSKTIKLIKK
jgi:hypothetical protein